MWKGSRNYAALFDGLVIAQETDVTEPWVLVGAREAILDASAVQAWKKRYRKDMVDVVRCMYFEDGREHGLSRPESAEYAADVLRGTLAECTPDGVGRLVSRMRRNESESFGRYYLGAGSAQWSFKHFQRRHSSQLETMWKWNQRAAARGNERSKATLERDLWDLKNQASRGGRKNLQRLRTLQSILRE